MAISFLLPLLAYWLWLFLAHLVGISLVTYGMLDGAPPFHEISDQYFAQYLTFQGVAGLLAFLLGWGLSASRPSAWAPFPVARWRTDFWLPFSRGALLAASFLVLLLVLAPFQYLGSGLSWADAPWDFLNTVARSIACVGWALGDEWVFRHLLLERARRFSFRFAEFGAVALTTGLWVLTRSWGQHLGWSQITTLALLGSFLALRVIRGASHISGAALWGSWTLVLHVLFSAPILGRDFAGFWMIRFSSAASTHASGFRFLTGGAGGPLSSVLIQALLLAAIARILWTQNRGKLR